MRPSHIALFALLLMVIIGILVIIWYFEGPDQGGYDQIKSPPVDRGISAFFGAYLPLLLLPFLLIFIIIVCYMRIRVQKREGAIINVANLFEAGDKSSVDGGKISGVDVRGAIGVSEGTAAVSQGAGGGSTTLNNASVAKKSSSSLRHLVSPVAIVAPAPVYAAPIRGDGISCDIPPHPRHSPLPPHSPPQPTPQASAARPIPPLPEFDDAPALPSRNGLPSYDTAVYQQLCSSPVPPGSKKQQQFQQHIQPQQQPVQQPIQQYFQEGSLTPTPVFERAGLKHAHSSSSISRGRVARTPNQSSKESAL